MPGYDTHYIFGINSYHKLPDSQTKHAIHCSKGAYSLGLIGPDIFFYYATEIVAARKNIGSLMHTTKTDLFFKNMLAYIDLTHGMARNTAIAYFSGFLSHYVLDCACHPYVYWRSDSNDLQKHFTLETDIDIMLLKKYMNTTPYDFTKNSTITLSKLENITVCDMLHFAIRNTYKGSRITRTGIRMAIRSLQAEQKAMRIAFSKIKSAIGVVEYHFVSRKYFSTLIPGGAEIKTNDPLNLKHSEWRNPWDPSKISHASVPDMMNKAQDRFSLTIFLLNNYLDKSISAKESYYSLLKFIGGYSYHSGLDWRKEIQINHAAKKQNY